MHGTTNIKKVYVDIQPRLEYTSVSQLLCSNRVIKI